MAEIIVQRDFGHNAKVVAAFFSVREPEREKERERERVQRTYCKFVSLYICA